MLDRETVKTWTFCVSSMKLDTPVPFLGNAQERKSDGELKYLEV